MPDQDLTRTDAASGGQDAPLIASTSAQSAQQERAQASSDFLREGRPRPAYTTPLDMSAEMDALAALPPGAARVVARSQPTISRPAMMNGELGVFVPLSALQEGVGIAEPIEQGAADAAEGIENSLDVETPVMTEEWYQAHLARQGVVSSGRWGVDSQDFTDTGSLDPTHVARRNAGKAWRRLLRLGHPAAVRTLRQRIGRLAFAAIMIVTLLGLLGALTLTIWLGGVAGGLPLLGTRLGRATATAGTSDSQQSTAVPSGSATSTAGTGGSQQPTVVPSVVPSGSAAIVFTLASQHLTAAGDLTSCPSGCDLTGQTYSASRTFSKQASATQIPQTALSGTIHASNAGPGDWSVSGYQFSGGGFTCNPRTIYLPQGTSADYSCFISASSPSTVPAGTIVGTASTSPNVTYTQPAALQGNGSYQVTSADCQASLNDTKTNQGVAWAASWQSGQSIPGGWQWATSAPTTSFGNDSCPVNQQQAGPFTFTASSSTTASNNAYNPAAAQSLAKARLNSQLPSGYAWKSGDPSACSVTVKTSSGTSVTLACPASGTAVYVWTDALKAELRAKLLGKRKDDALAACNSTPGVQANSCAITLREGATSLPDVAKDVTIQVNQP